MSPSWSCLKPARRRGRRERAAPEMQRRDGGGSEGCRSRARVGADLAPSTPAGSIPRGTPLASNPCQHSAVTRAVRNPRGPLPLPGLLVRPSASSAYGHVVVGSLTDARQPNPVLPCQIAVTLLTDLIEREFSIFTTFLHMVTFALEVNFLLNYSISVFSTIAKRFRFLKTNEIYL